jgi:hypothetical protein
MEAGFQPLYRIEQWIAGAGGAAAIAGKGGEESRDPARGALGDARE